MPRTKKRDEPDNNGKHRYLSKHDGGGEESGSERKDVSLISLQWFLTREFQKLNTELKDIYQILMAKLLTFLP